MSSQPALPTVPAFYRALRSDFRRTLRARDFDNLADAIVAMNTWTPAQRAEVDAYNAQVAVYNAWLDRQRAAHNAKVTAARAAAARAKLQAATCRECFTVHAGECY
jgi:hypothetical protein